MTASYHLDTASLDASFLELLKKQFQGRKIYIDVYDEHTPEQKDIAVLEDRKNRLEALLYLRECHQAVAESRLEPLTQEEINAEIKAYRHGM